VIGFIKVLEKIIISVIKKSFKKKKAKPEGEQQSETHSEISSNVSGSTKIVDDESPTKSGRCGREKDGRANFYENLKDFESDDFRHYEKTLVAEAECTNNNRF